MLASHAGLTQLSGLQLRFFPVPIFLALALQTIVIRSSISSCKTSTTLHTFTLNYGVPKMNGTLLQFANNIDVHVMNKPKGYSAATMKDLAKRYSKLGAKINQNRTHNSVGKTESGVCP